VVAGLQGDPAALLRDHLIEAAERLLSDRQVTAITTRDLARAAEVSEGVLYNYFDDKNELLLTALVLRFEELVAQLRIAVPEAGSRTVREDLEQLAFAVLELHVAGLPLFGKLMTDPRLMARFWHEIHAGRVGVSGGDIRGIVKEHLEKERRRGRIGTCDTGAAADLLLGSVGLLALLEVIAGLAAHDRVAGLVDTLLSGLTPTGKSK